LSTTQQLDNSEDICITMSENSIEQLLGKEWLLTNKRGSYSSTTLAGCNTRKYHGLLIGSLTPPVQRVMALSSCIETIETGGKQYNLTGFEFDGTFSPSFVTAKKFHQDSTVRFEYRLGDVDVTKSICLSLENDSVAIIYDFLHIDEPVNFSIRPFVALRDFHALLKSDEHFVFYDEGKGPVIRRNLWGDSELHLSSEQAVFAVDQQWWYNILYRQDRDRCEEYKEDLWSPGVFNVVLDSPKRIIIRATLKSIYTAEGGIETPALPQSAFAGVSDFVKAVPDRSADKLQIEQVQEELFRHRQQLKEKAKLTVKDNKFAHLVLAADQFVVKRQIAGKEGWTIVAGYPWFADWGRDAFVSLPGLLLSAGRFEEAKSVLTTFVQAADGGMIPNYFADRTNKAEFNSVDASLWFIDAAFEYLRASGDTEGFSQQFLPMIRWIIHSYCEGARFGIRMDADGLVTGGDKDTQLTWMDAKYAGFTFTPRFGKAVEVNALWYNALCNLSQFYSDRKGPVSQQYRTMAERTKDSFKRMFWNEIMGYLNDCISPDGQIDASLRPNQIFAVSQVFSPLEDYQRRSVVNVVQKRLLTPYGLRTLDICDRRYKGTYNGSWRERDEAYHQGTVWPFLLGAFVRAYLKVNNFSSVSKEEATKYIEPLLEHITSQGCIGQVSEIFDGSQPHRPRGCFAQAWSIAELIRAYLLVNTR
jgi:glycogen debranching enzyme